MNLTTSTVGVTTTAALGSRAVTAGTVTGWKVATATAGMSITVDAVTRVTTTAMDTIIIKS